MQRLVPVEDTVVFNLCESFICNRAGQYTTSGYCPVPFTRVTIPVPPPLLSVTSSLFSINGDDNQAVDLYDLSQRGIQPAITHTGSQHPYKFVITFENAQQIDTLYVTSTRSNVKKSIPAIYDKASGAFIAEGYFDETNKTYVPGALGIEYTKAFTPVTIKSEYDWSIFDDQIATRTDETVLVHKATETDSVTEIDLGSVYSGLENVIVNASVSIYDKATHGNLGDWLGVFKELDKISSYIVPGEDGETYKVSMDYSDPYSYVMLVRDISGSKFIKLAFDSALKKTDDLESMWTLTQISGALSTINTTTNLLYKQHSIEREMDKLRDEVWQTFYATPEQRQEALRQVDKLELDQSFFTLTTAVIPLIISTGLPAVGATMTMAPILFTALLGVFTSVAPMFWQIRTAQIKGENYKIKWHIDPSGYVYDTATNERLQGVTVTAYCILRSILL